MNTAAKILGLAALLGAGAAVWRIAAPNPQEAIMILPANAQQPGQAVGTVATAGVTLHSVKVSLPPGAEQFPGADAEAINNNCLACHSPSMVLTQPALTRETWQKEVDKMRQQFKAPVVETDIPAIVAWLTAHKGPPTTQ
jgi:hypothetical protein